MSMLVADKHPYRKLVPAHMCCAARRMPAPDTGRPASFRPCNKQYSTAFITDGAGSLTACVGGVRFDDFGRRKLVARGSRYATMPSASFGELNRIAVRIMSSHRTLPGL